MVGTSHSSVALPFLHSKEVQAGMDSFWERWLSPLLVSASVGTFFHPSTADPFSHSKELQAGIESF